MLSVGDKAPSFALPTIEGGTELSDPWTEGTTALMFFKVSCPVCKMVAPMVTALAQGDARVVAIGQDPADALVRYAEDEGQHVTTVSEAAPYPVSAAYDLEAVPSLYLVDGDGVIVEAIGGWNRDTWNKLAESVGLEEPLSTPDDGLRPFRPG